MATISVGSIPLQRSILKRPPLRLTAQRLAANRRNAARSTGPRSVKGKARVARNAIKHGFFADAQRWSEQQHRDFAQLFAGLCADFRPQSERDETSVAVVADCYVRMAAVWRYESIAALKEHQRAEREMNQRIATATLGSGAAGGASRGVAARRFVAADHPGTSRGGGDHSVRGPAASGDSHGDSGLGA